MLGFYDRIYFSEKPILIHVKKDVVDLIAVNVCFIFAAQNLFEIKLRLVCARVLVECAKNLLFNDYRQAYRESFGRNTFQPLLRAV